MSDQFVPRNKELWKKLVAVFKTVIPADAGGEHEEYRVNCPFCGDTKHRLYFNHQWGIYDPLLGRRQIAQVNCYNEQCVQPRSDEPLTLDERYENRSRLVQWLCGGLSYHVNITPATQQTQRSSEEPVTWPGRVIKLDRLAVLRPNHPAVRYMQIRGFDPMELGRDYGFAFCDKVEDLRYKMAEGTIIMPIWKGDQMFSWISRYVGDTYHGKPLSETPIKKYYNMPGRSLTTLSYNLDQALCYSTIVIVEGVLDCIRTGPYAACLFTKTISQTTKRLILRGLAKYAEEAAVVVMLDPVQNEKDKNRGSLHHIERLASEFHPKYLSRVVRVYLPDGNDPANMTREELREQIERAAREQRVPICLEPKEVYDATVITDRLSRIASARQRLVQNVAYRCRTGSSDDLRNSQNQE